MFLPYSYDDGRDGEWAIYDLDLLIEASSEVELAVVLRALQRIPEAYGLTERTWSSNRCGHCLWIDRSDHDSVYGEIRNRVTSDAEYVVKTTDAMRNDIDALATALSAAPTVNVFEATVCAATWMSANWLHPQSAVRMAIRRDCTSIDDDPDALFSLLLVGPHESLLRLAYTAAVGSDHSQVGSLVDEWGAAFEDKRPSAISSDLAAIRASASDQDLALAYQAARQRDLSMEYGRQLVARVAAVDGLETSRLLHAQVELLRTTVWQEERRRVLQERALRVLNPASGPPAVR